MYGRGLPGLFVASALSLGLGCGVSASGSGATAPDDDSGATLDVIGAGGDALVDGLTGDAPEDAPPEDVWPAVTVLEAWVEPNATSVLAAWVHLETDAPVSVRVGAWREGNLDWQSEESVVATSHRVAVLGMRPVTSYDLSLQLWREGAVVVEPEPLVFETGALSPTLPPITVSTHDPDRSAGGVTIFGPQARDQEEGDPTWPLFLGVDMLGVPIWTYQDATLDHGVVARDLTRLDDGNFLLRLGEGVRIVTPAGEMVHEWLESGGSGADAEDSVSLGGAYHHDAILLPSGNVVAIGFDEREVDMPSLGGVVVVRGDTLREVSPLGEVVWSWSGFDHLEPIVLPGPLSSEPNPKGGHYDWTHANGVVYEEATDTLLVSLRHQNQVIRIERSTGAVVDRIGPSGDHTLLWGDWFYSQHSPEIGSDGSLLVYDNGTERVDEDTGAQLPKPERYSRAVLYAVDTEARTVSQLWAYEVPEFTVFVGDADRLTNGNVLVCAGGVRGANTSGLARLHEVTADTPAELVWALEIEAVVYRATRLPSLSL